MIAGPAFVKVTAGPAFLINCIFRRFRMDAPSQLVPSSMVIDDLKLIRGIGPGIESRLNDAGIFTYAQLADCTPAYLAELFSGLTGMSVHRIQEKDLIGQARRKASETKPVNTDMDPNV
jgi:predicted flap endonuclease-1-like 5' DNA nuclease